MRCPYCEAGDLFLVEADEPWHAEHYQCTDCDSTYNIGEIDDGCT